nr:transposase family protein [Actinomyces sp. HMSC075C01]
MLDVPTTDLPDGTPPPRYIGDKGYIGLGMITPKRKPPNLPLHPDDKTYNKTVNQVSATRSSEPSPTSRPGESRTPATEDH